jgi:transcriptional regulator with XRE-family HTH domain
MDLPHILGRNVRQARLQKGMSQEELAFQADMKRSYLSVEVRGASRQNALEAIFHIAARRFDFTKRRPRPSISSPTIFFSRSITVRLKSI